MKNRKKLLALLLAGCLSAGSISLPNVGVTNVQAAEEAFVTDLTVEYLTAPLGIEADSVTFGWKMNSTKIGERQSAYQIQVLDESGSLVWDSQKVESSDSTGIVCGAELAEKTRYQWNVTVWNQDGSQCSESDYFETGVTNWEEWKNTPFIQMNKSAAAPVFRTEQSLTGGKISKARLYITAMGAYQAYINGNQVGELKKDGSRVYHHMNPGYGNKNISLGYQTYDVTGYLGTSNTAALSIVGGNGWYNGMAATQSSPAVKALLVIDYADGTSQTIGTNANDWKGTLMGGITGNGVYYGEDYNACYAEELGDYTQAGYDDSAWEGAQNDGTETSIPCIENSFETQTAQHVRILVTQTGPANDANENFLQIMEIELLDEDGNNVIRNQKANVSNTWSPNAQWSETHLTDGDYGTDSDYGYTTTLLGYGGTTWSLENDPVSIAFSLDQAVDFCRLKMYPRTSVNSISGNECSNYPKKYTLQISQDGSNWSNVKNWTVDSVKNRVPMKLSETSYSGEIRAQAAIPGKLNSEYDQHPVSAVIYNGTKAQSSYAGGEIDILSSYEAASGENIFADGIQLLKGETMIVNMGQNLTAVPQIQFEGERGTKLTMRFAEMLNDGSAVGNGATQADGPKGSIYQKSIRGARSRATYIFSGNGKEQYQPMMSFFGYQYVEITADEDVTIYGLCSKAISSVSDKTGSIVTNNENVNKLLSNVQYGQMSNYYTTPTDCNQRDERLSWTGDTQAFAQTAVYNFDSAAFLKEMQEIYQENAWEKGYVPAVADDLTGYFSNWAAGWSDVLVVVPWVLYQQTGDLNILKENWDVLVHYMDYMKSIERGPDQAPAPNNGMNYGDWLSFQGTSIEVINDYYYGYMNQLMAKMAKAVGDTEKETEYSDKFEAIKEKFIETHVDFTDGNLVIKSKEGNVNLQFQSWTDKKGVWENNSQTSLLWMLKLGFYDSDEMRKAAEELLLENIKNENPDSSSVRAKYGENTLAVGFLGSNVITPVLTDIGHSDVSYDLLLQDGQPSWLFEVKAGATTVWERWNSYTPGVGFGDSEMNSFNHYAYGSVAEWMYRYMAGICADEENPGFKNVILQPTLDTGSRYNEEERINAVDASYDSYYGKIMAGWKSEEGKLASYYAQIPANTTAVLYLPVEEVAVQGLKEIPGVTYNKMTEHNGQMTAEFTLLSGGYEFAVENGKLKVSYQPGYGQEATPTPTPTKKPELQHKSHKGKTFLSNGLKYKVTKDDKSGREVRVTSMAKNKKTLTIPAQVTNSEWKETFKVTSVKSKAFKGKKITKTVIGKNVTVIGPNAFLNCKKLKSVVIGMRVKNIGIRAFYGCTKLKKVTIKSTVLKNVKKNAFKKISSKAVIKVPKSKKKAYARKLRTRIAKGVKVK